MVAQVNKKRKLDNGTQNEENKLCLTCNIRMAKRRFFFFLDAILKINKFFFIKKDVVFIKLDKTLIN